MSISAIINLNVCDNYSTVTDFSCLLVWLCFVIFCCVNKILPFYVNAFCYLLSQFIIAACTLSLHCSWAVTHAGHPLFSWKSTQASFEA